MLGMDIVGKLNTGNSKYLLTIQDYFTKFGIIIPMDSICSKDIKRELKAVFKEYGHPDIIVSDNGVQFKSAEFTKFIDSKNIAHWLTPLYAPHVNGQVERFNRCVKGKIHEAEDNEIENVKKFLMEWLGAFNTTPRGSTGISPYELLYGEKKRTNIHRFYQGLPLPKSIYDGGKVNEKKKSAAVRHDEKMAPKRMDLGQGDQVRIKLENGRYTEPRGVMSFTDSTVTLSNGDTWHRKRVSLCPDNSLLGGEC